MKQLKVIQSSYTSTNGIFTASFKDSFTIDPLSRIMFDKISFTISNGNVTGFTVPNQSVLINPAANHPTSVTRSATIMGNTYPTLTDLMRVLNSSYNKVLDSGPLTPIVNNVPSDLGLAFYNGILIDPVTKQNTYTFAFDQALVQTDLDPIPINITGHDGVWTPDADEDYSYLSPSAILMGALSCSLSILGFNSLTTGTTFVMGLGDEDVNNSEIACGISWDGRNMSIINNGQITHTIPNPEMFNNGHEDADQALRCYFFITNGELRFALVDMTSEYEDIWNYKYITPLGIFPGYNVNTPYYFQFWGRDDNASNSIGFSLPQITFDGVLTKDNQGSYIDLSKLSHNTYLSRPLLGQNEYPPWDPPSELYDNRSVRLDFTNANTLLNGLGFTTPILQTITNVDGTITGSVPVGFVANQELELDVFDLPLDTYVSNSNGNSGRVNALSFFTPLLVNPNSQGSAQFYYENKVMPFIDVKNQFPQIIESLSFRLFNPTNPTYAINFQNISFTMYIQSPKDGLALAFA
ncbi:MAG: hypothetical protein WCI60_01635 [bacterium]